MKWLQPMAANDMPWPKKYIVLTNSKIYALGVALFLRAHTKCLL